MRTIVSYCLLLFGLSACFEPELTDLSFFNVRTMPATTDDNLSAGVFILHGQFDTDRSEDEIVDHGFYWARTIEELTARSGLTFQQLSLGSYTGGDVDFSAESPNVSSDVTWFFQAYAKAGEREVFGEILPISYQLSTFIFPPQPSNDSVRIIFRLNNLSRLGASVNDFGLLIAADNPMATVENADTVFRAGPQSDDVSTSRAYVFPRFNTTYYARTFYEGASIVYGEPEEIVLEDGWKQIDSFPVPITGTAMAWHQGSGWSFGGIVEGGINRHKGIYQFTPNAEPLLSSWQLTPVGELQLGFDEGEVLSWGNDLLYGFGAWSDQGATGWRVYPGQSLLPVANGANPSDSIYVDGLTFELNDRFYYGTGVRNGVFNNEFWELREENGQWFRRSVAKLPHFANGVEVDTVGRFGAVVFEVDGEVYVGGGNGPSIQFTDLYRFIPPDPDAPTSIGSWDYYGELPGLRRKGATAISLGDRAFYGMGINEEREYLRDWWMFCPQASSGERWQQQASCPGPPREGAKGFAYDGNLFLGTGEGVVLTANNELGRKKLSDFWVYFPKAK